MTFARTFARAAAVTGAPAVTGATAAAAVVTFAALAGCGAAGGASQPAVVFPSAQEVARMPGKAPLAEAFGVDVVPVDTWTFESVPIPDGATYDDPSPSGELLREEVKAHAGTVALSPPLLCTAREMARFHLKKQALPAESLRRFIAARCGAVAPVISPVVASTPASAAVTDQQIVASIRQSIHKLFEGQLSRGHHLIGMAVARDAERASLVAVITDDDVRLEAGVRSVDSARRVTLRGGVRGDFAEIGAVVNRGEAGTAPCVSDPSVAVPRFAVQCELAPSDRFAWVEVIGRKKEGTLLHELAESLIYDGDGRGVAYVAPHLGPPAPAHTNEELTTALVDRLNGVRRAAKLAPLALAAKQSAQNARLAGTLVDAMVALDDGSAERAAMGLLAGWSVEGLIRNGTFFVGVVGPERDAAAWLDFALERPLGRISLLDPEARQIAVGPTMPQGASGIGAAVTTYSFFGSEDHTADADRFFERLTAARAALSLPAPVRITGLNEMRSESARVLREGKAPMDALNDMMAVVVDRTRRSVQGYVLETNDLSRVEVPKQLLTRGPLEVVLGVTHHRAPGAAWGQYVVFAIVLGSAGQGGLLTASVLSAPRAAAL